MLAANGINAARDTSYYHFLTRVIRLYHKYGPHGRLHEARHSHTVNAVTSIFHDMPACKLPHGGDPAEATRVILPILAELYKMPKIADGPDDRLQRKLLRPLEASIQDLVQYEELLLEWIVKMQAQGKRILSPHEMMPHRHMRRCHIAS